MHVRRAKQHVIAVITLGALVMTTACAGSDDGDDTPAPSPTPASLAERLIAAHGDGTLDPSRAAWDAVIADPVFETKPVSVAEFVRLRDDAGARDGYDAWLDALTPAVAQAGGTMVTVADILFPGLEGLDGYDGGVAWVATLPSLRAYTDVMLDERVVAAAPQRRDAIEEAQVLAGENIVPAPLLELAPNAPASDFPTDLVAGKSAEQVVSELLAVYPSGGADPTKETLERMLAYDGFLDQRVHFINLYRFKEGGEQSLGEYNVGALPHVLRHGGRPKVLANVGHHLVGPTAWDRFIVVSWPSLAVFTDLRLDPPYLEAQKDRVVSGDQYGNLIMIDRADKR